MLLCWPSTGAFAQIIYVATNGSDAANGLTPGTAVRTIQVGITKALVAGYGEIDVSQGLYTNGAGLNPPSVGRGIIITNDSLRILGGWNLAFGAQSGVTELDGNGLLTNIIFVTNANSVYINNFTIRRGNAPTAGLLSGCGAGMFLWNVNSSSFSSLTVTNNTANLGAGIFLTNSCGNNFQITVQSNTSVSFGGGLHLSYSHSNRINGAVVSNRGGSGGGAWLLNSFANTLNADFMYNQAFSGAGLYLNASDSNTVNGTFYRNVGTGDGGAVYVFSASNLFTGAMNSNAASVNGGAVYIAAGASNTFTGIMSSNVCGTGSGGALAATAGGPNTTITGDLINNTSTGGSGGALYLASPYNTISGNMMSNSSSSVGGAAHIQTTSGTNTFSGNVIKNTSSGNGGGIYLQCSGNVVSGDFVSNTSPANGGGLYVNGSFNVITGKYSYNYATGGGGGIRMHACFFNTVNVAANDNASAGDGGGMVLVNSLFNSVNGLFSRNTNGNYGGGVSMSGSHSNTISASFYSNTSGSFGGGIYFNTCHSNTFSGLYLSNTCRNGSGGGMALNGFSNLVSADFIQNSANQGGGAYFLSGANGGVFTGTAFANYSQTSGGAFAIWNSHLNLFAGTVMSNGTLSNGAAYSFGASHSNIISGTILSNTSGLDGGGIYLSGCFSNVVSAAFISNKGQFGGAMHDYAGNFNSFCGSALYNRSVQGALYLSNTAAFKLTNAFFSNNVASAAYDTAVMLQNNTGGITGLFISNTTFSGSGAANAFAIQELGNNVTGQTIVGNYFLTNSLAFLYSNFNGGMISNTEIGVLNTPSSARHDATTAYANSVLPIPIPVSAAFFGPVSWVTNVPAVFTSSSSPGGLAITNYLWRFGDGATSNGSNVSVSHTYNSALNGYVTLTVWDNIGGSNTVSNALNIYLFQLVGGKISGTTSNGVTLSLASAVTQMSGTSDLSGAYSLVVSNDTYSLTPYKLGYRFSPTNRTVVVFNAHTSNNDFTSVDIYPQLVLSNLRSADKIKRDMPLLITSDAPEILSTITYTVSNLSSSNHYSASFNKPYGIAAIFDTTLQPDGDYRITVNAVDTVFLRTHTTNLVVTFDNGLFKVLDKDLENLKAIAYDTVRHPAKNETLEFFFYIKDNQKMKIHLYNKLGRPVLSYGEQPYSHGHNRVALDLPMSLPTGPYYAVFECPEFKKTVLFVVSQ